MKKEEIFSELKLIIEEMQGFNITETMTLQDTDMDSIDIIETIFECEKKFQIDIPDAEVETLQNFGQLADIISNKIASAA